MVGMKEIRASAAAIDASLSHPEEEEGDVLVSLQLVLFFRCS
jgi:hypothetical protein